MWQLLSSRVSHPRETMRKRLRSKLQTFCNLIMVIHIRCAVFYLLVASQSGQPNSGASKGQGGNGNYCREVIWVVACLIFFHFTHRWIHTHMHTQNEIHTNNYLKFTWFLLDEYLIKFVRLFYCLIVTYIWTNQIFSLFIKLHLVLLSGTHFLRYL